jgi:hypothetical protein
MPCYRTVPLTREETEALVHARDHDPRPDVRERCAAVLKVAAGEHAHAVARHGLLRPRHPDPVYSWLDLYAAAGLEGLRIHRHGGARRRRL